ncbi:unnamed protein product [Mytilus edulis]|uniref:MADF domain-containing protein n=1 Tax=Mytilus edulis TaxID=6550 RepID=A0A8S3RZU4_MYTED|nr:unnamed protein product [Mytilus edulis]
MRAKKKPAPAMKKTTRQPRKRKTIPISPMHSSAEEYEGDSDPVEEVQQVHSSETEPVAIPAMVITEKPRSSGFHSEEDEDKMIEWLQENRFIYDMESKIYKDKSSKTTAWQTQAENLGFEVRCLLTWYDSVRTRYGKLAARPSGSGAELTDREKWILDNLKFHKPYIHRVKKKTPLKGKITAATDATVDDASSSIVDAESTQDMQ